MATSDRDGDQVREERTGRNFGHLLSRLSMPRLSLSSKKEAFKAKFSSSRSKATNSGATAEDEIDQAQQERDQGEEDSEASASTSEQSLGNEDASTPTPMMNDTLDESLPTMYEASQMLLHQPLEMAVRKYRKLFIAPMRWGQVHIAVLRVAWDDAPAWPPDGCFARPKLPLLQGPELRFRVQCLIQIRGWESDEQEGTPDKDGNGDDGRQHSRGRLDMAWLLPSRRASEPAASQQQQQAQQQPQQAQQQPQQSQQQQQQAQQPVRRVVIPRGPRRALESVAEIRRRRTWAMDSLLAGHPDPNMSLKVWRAPHTLRRDTDWFPLPFYYGTDNRNGGFTGRRLLPACQVYSFMASPEREFLLVYLDAIHLPAPYFVEPSFRRPFIAGLLIAAAQVQYYGQQMEKPEERRSRDEVEGHGSGSGSGSGSAMNSDTPVPSESVRLLFSDAASDATNIHVYTASVPHFLLDHLRRPAQPIRLPAAYAADADPPLPFVVIHHTRVAYQPWRDFRSRLKDAFCGPRYQPSDEGESMQSPDVPVVG